MIYLALLMSTVGMIVFAVNIEYPWNIIPMIHLIPIGYCWGKMDYERL
jgi:hypothetical protein